MRITRDDLRRISEAAQQHSELCGSKDLLEAFLALCAKGREVREKRQEDGFTASPNAQHYIEYEWRKSQLPHVMEPGDYEKTVQQIAEELGV